MNVIIIFAVMPLLCGAIAAFLVLKDSVQKRHTIVTLRSTGHANGHLIRSLTFLPLAAAVYLVTAWQPANAQEIIHARAGQIVAMNPSAKAFTLKITDGSTLVFKDVQSPEPAMSFDKEVRSKTVAASTGGNIGDYVVVFYFGVEAPTAVAIKELGNTDPQRTTGVVVGYDRHKRLLMLKDGSEEPQRMTISDNTIVDTPEGVIKADNFRPNKGEQLRCLTTPQLQAAVLVVPD